MRGLVGPLGDVRQAGDEPVLVLAMHAAGEALVPVRPSASRAQRHDRVGAPERDARRLLGERDRLTVHLVVVPRLGVGGAASAVAVVYVDEAPADGGVELVHQSILQRPAGEMRAVGTPETRRVIVQQAGAVHQRLADVERHEAHARALGAGQRLAAVAAVVDLARRPLLRQLAVALGGRCALAHAAGALPARVVAHEARVQIAAVKVAYIQAVKAVAGAQHGRRAYLADGVRQRGWPVKVVGAVKALGQPVQRGAGRRRERSCLKAVARRPLAARVAREEQQRRPRRHQREPQQHPRAAAPQQRPQRVRKGEGAARARLEDARPEVRWRGSARRRHRRVLGQRGAVVEH
mmetsp:Transcript_1754/g.5055  ORF Transcript_1754/g.5055 Transcript_1754/m.5055 type:complete len:350 (-) Transcript_1754:243-1292(-)